MMDNEPHHLGNLIDTLLSRFGAQLFWMDIRRLGGMADIGTGCACCER